MLILCVKWQTECAQVVTVVGHGRISFPTLCHQIFGSRIILFFFLPFQGQYEVPSGWKPCRFQLANCFVTQPCLQEVAPCSLEEYRDDEL